jgi:16S rRNA (adenine1518-N6/adenine1519-N6)-dimethyltransferase
VTFSRRQLVELLDRHGITLSRALGQNYVADPNTVRRIARLAGVGPGDHVVEIGAGVGSLTLALAETGARVTAIEVDRHIVPVLRAVLAEHGLARPDPGPVDTVEAADVAQVAEVAAAHVSQADGAAERADPADRVQVVEGDARGLDWDVVVGAGPAVLVANLPYNIATTLVLDLLESVPGVERMLVMVQREVGERLAAGPGSKVYGIPSVKRAWYAAAEVVGRVPATVFVPEPKVSSVLVALQRRPPPAVDVAPAEVFGLVDTAFGQRRKMLRRSLAAAVDGDATFAAAGVAPESRPEQLSVDRWASLARAVRDAPGGRGPAPRRGLGPTPGEPGGASTRRDRRAAGR